MTDATIAVSVASYVQRALWEESRARIGSSSLTDYRVYDVRGPLDLSRLRSAAADLALRHAALSTTLRPLGGLLRQHVSPRSWLPLEIHPSIQPPLMMSGGISTIRRLLCREWAVSGVLPLVRYHVVSVDEEKRRHLLAVAAHPAVADAWSLELIAGDLAAIYEGGPGAVESGRHYAEWVEHEGDLTRHPSHAERVRWWTGQLADADTGVPMPDGSRPQPGAQARRARLQPWRPIEGGTAARLEQVAHECGGSVAAVSAVALSLAMHADARRVVVGVTDHEREPSYRRTVGPIATRTPLVVDLADDPTAGQLIERAGRAMRDARARPVHPGDLAPLLAHPDGDGPPIGLGVDVEPPSPRRWTAGDVTLSRMTVRPAQQAHEGWWPGAVMLDCRLRATDEGDGWAAEFVFDGTTLAPAAVLDVADRWRRLIDRLIADLSEPVSAVRLSG